MLNLSRPRWHAISNDARCFMPSWRESLANFGFCNGNETRDSRDRNMTRNSWRRTAFTSISGDVEIAPDDWTLLDPSGEPLARLYKVMGGPQNGRWYWTVLFRPDGSVGNGGNGFTATGREAREACEARIPETMRD